MLKFVSKKNLKYVVIMLSGFALTACQSERENLNIGLPEKIDFYEGLFPENVTSKIAKQKNATTNVIDAFKNNPASIKGKPAETMHKLALFEWLANDLKGNHSIPAYKIRKILDTRNQLREKLGFTEQDTAGYVIARLMSMSRFMKVIVSQNTNAGIDPAYQEQRELLSKLKENPGPF